MEYEKITLEGFSLVGISVRTTNKSGQSQLDIDKLWRKFIENNIVDSIPFKISEDIYCIYTDYESDFSGEYTAIIGCKVSNTNDTTDEFVYIDIPTCNYYKFTSIGKIPEAVGKTWEHIWQSAYSSLSILRPTSLR